MAIDRTDVLRIARLARIHLGDDEADLLARDLERIVEHVAQLDEADLPEGGETCFFDTDVHREDRTAEGLDREDALRNAPDTDGEFFLAPRILDKDAT